MKQTIRRTSAWILALVLVLGMQLITAYPVQAAETANVSVSSVSGDVGDQITVNISVSGSGSEIYMCDLYVTYDASVLQIVSGHSGGGGGTVRVLSTDSTSFSLVFKALKPGTSSIKLASNSIVSSELEDKLTISGGNGSVTVNSSANLSSNNNLSSLKIAESALSPEFSSDVTSYTAAIGQDVSRLTVSAVPEDAAATVRVTGTTMDPGRNTTTITVTAENGSTRSYIIYTTKESAADGETAGKEEADNESASQDIADIEVQQKAIATIDGTEYYIISDFDSNPLPAGYETEVFEYKGQKILAGKGIYTKLTIMYLEPVNGSQDGAFYVYDTVNDTFYRLNVVISPELRYTILPITDDMELPDGYAKATRVINDENADVLVKLGAGSDYCLFYGMDDEGNTGWYRYDYTNGTVQKFTDLDEAGVDALGTTVMQEQDEVKMWRMMTVCIAAGALILLVMVIVLLIKDKKRLNGEQDQNNDSDGSDKLKKDGRTGNTERSKKFGITEKAGKAEKSKKSGKSGASGKAGQNDFDEDLSELDEDVISGDILDDEDDKKNRKKKKKQKELEKASLEDIADDIADDAQYRDIEDGSAFEDDDEESDFEFLDIEETDIED